MCGACIGACQNVIYIRLQLTFFLANVFWWNLNSWQEMRKDVCVFVCVHACMHLCVHVCVCVCVYMYTCVCVCILGFACVWMSGLVDWIKWVSIINYIYMSVHIKSKHIKIKRLWWQVSVMHDCEVCMRLHWRVLQSAFAFGLAYRLAMSLVPLQ